MFSIQNLLCQRGKRRKKEDEFDYPRSVSVSPDGDLYITDTGNNRLIQLNSAGIVKEKYGTFGSGSREFNDPVACSVALTGRILVCDRKNSRLHSISFQTDRANSIQLPAEPVAVQVSSWETIVIAFADGTIRHFDGTGRELYKWSLMQPSVLDQFSGLSITLPNIQTYSSPKFNEDASIRMAFAENSMLYVSDRIRN